ncbi:response regulator [uncultured Polaribacter sp.]|uniref:LytR/AlgR family response regulator transcription factor n=1 Tax=uncultured Polaribacter sp. TaxID=174711 RepID=UPI002625C647|nr:response regulator [uncultured Polaribacter sp.]
MSQQRAVFIVEDNAINKLTLETILEENNFDITGSASNAEEAWEDLKNTVVDIVLIDINLAGDKNGIWLAEKIRKEKNTALIYLTAYGDKKTIDKVKKTRPNGYLMKPYNEPTLLTTIEIAIESFTSKKTKTSKNLFIKDNYIQIKINSDDILYIQSSGNYLEIFAKDKKYLIRAKISDFINQLPQENFLKVHRRSIINLQKVDMVGNGFVKINNQEISISKTFKKELHHKLEFL